MWTLSGQFFNIIISEIKNKPPLSYLSLRISIAHLLTVGTFCLSFDTMIPLPQFSFVLDYLTEIKVIN